MDAMKKFIFTPENLIENLEKIGPWSSYGLATDALQHYFPEEYDEHGYCEPDIELNLLERLNCKYWQDVIIKYQKEIGYKTESGQFNTVYVNEH